MSPGVLRYFHPVLPSKSLRKKPVQITVAGQTYVLFRDATQRVGALADLCPHRRAPLSQGWVRSDGRLACPYHGWNFDADGKGRSPSCPNLKHCDTRAYQVAEQYGYLWIAERETPKSALPVIESQGFEFAGALSTVFAAPMEVTLDNITEDEHFAYVHSTFGWDEGGWSEVSVSTLKSDDQTEVRYVGPQRASFWAPLGGVRKGDRFNNHW